MTLTAGYHGDRINILGVNVSAINLGDAVAVIRRWIREDSHQYVCVSGAHGVMECRRNERLRQIHNESGMVTPDGMPLVWMARLLGSKRVTRVYGPDLMRKVTEISASNGYRQFYYGAAGGTADKLKEALVRAHPGLQVAGTYSPPYRELTPVEDEAVINAINAAHPHILWVGLSTPKQEFWMANHLGKLNVPVMIGVGAAFDFLAGSKRQAPRWMQRRGLEWLFRLLTEPRRLWRRYAFVVPGFAFLAARQLFGQAFRPAPASTSRSPQVTRRSSQKPNNTGEDSWA
jgi:N-acetylglucosaminyldiphosphoundecaprenol N-acetyl-beta-D-mannosaminyltransferase